jgi:hypothetical protein
MGIYRVSYQRQRHWLQFCCTISSAVFHMTRGRDTGEQTLKRVDALFFEVYTGPDSVPKWLQGSRQCLVSKRACDSAAPDVVVELVCSCVLCLRSVTETILLLKYYRYVLAVAIAVVIPLRGPLLSPDAGGACSTGWTALSPHGPCTVPPSRRGSSTAICCGASIPRLPMLPGQTRR